MDPSVREKIKALEKRVAEQEAEARSQSQRLRTWRQSRLPIPPPSTTMTLPDLPQRARTFATLQPAGCSGRYIAGKRQPISAIYSPDAPGWRPPSPPPGQKISMPESGPNVSPASDTKKTEHFHPDLPAQAEKQTVQVATISSAIDSVKYDSVVRSEAVPQSLSGRSPSIKITTPAKHAAEIYIGPGKDSLSQLRLGTEENGGPPRPESDPVITVAKNVETSPNQSQPDTAIMSGLPPIESSGQAVEMAELPRPPTGVDDASQEGAETSQEVAVSVTGVKIEPVDGSAPSTGNQIPVATKARDVSDTLHEILFWRADSTGQKLKADESWIRNPSKVGKRSTSMSFASAPPRRDANLLATANQPIVNPLPPPDRHHSPQPYDKALQDVVNSTLEDETTLAPLIPEQSKKDTRRPSASSMETNVQGEPPVPPLDPVSVAARVIEAQSAIDKVKTPPDPCKDTTSPSSPIVAPNDPVLEHTTKVSAGEAPTAHSTQASPTSEKSAYAYSNASSASDQGTIVRSSFQTAEMSSPTRAPRQPSSAVGSGTSPAAETVPEYEISVQPHIDSLPVRTEPVLSRNEDTTETWGETEHVERLTGAACSPSNPPTCRADEAATSPKIEWSSDGPHSLGTEDKTEGRGPTPSSFTAAGEVKNSQESPANQGLSTMELDKCYQMTMRAILDYSIALRQHRDELMELLTQTKAILESPVQAPTDPQACRCPNPTTQAIDRHIAFLAALIKTVEAYAREGWHVDLSRELPLLNDAAEKGQQARAELFAVRKPVKRPDRLRYSPPIPPPLSRAPSRAEEYGPRTPSPHKPARPLMEELRALKRTERPLLLRDCDVFVLVPEESETGSGSEGFVGGILDHYRYDD